MKVSYVAKVKMAKLRAEIEKEEKEERLVRGAIHTYSICPYCGEDLHMVLLPSNGNTFGGIQKSCKIHGVLYDSTLPFGVNVD